jgi:hypothetical protein
LGVRFSDRKKRKEKNERQCYEELSFEHGSLAKIRVVGDFLMEVVQNPSVLSVVNGYRKRSKTVLY